MRRFILRFFVFLFLLVLAGHFLFFNYIIYGGKSDIETVLSRKFGRPVTIGQIGLWIPFGLRFDDLRVPGILKVKTAVVVFGIPDFRGERLRFSEIILKKPVIYASRAAGKGFQLGLKVNPHPVTGVSSFRDSGGSLRRRLEARISRAFGHVLIQKLEMEDGRLEYKDFSEKTVTAVSAREIYFRTGKLAVPLSGVKTDFELYTRVFSPDLFTSGCQIRGDGWIDPAGKNMNARLFFIESDGTPLILAKLRSVKNHLSVRGNVNIARMTSKFKTGPVRRQDLRSVLINAAQASGIGLKVDFAFETKMDDVRISKIPFFGIAAYDAGSDAASGIEDVGRQLKNWGRKFLVEGLPVPSGPSPNESLAE